MRRRHRSGDVNFQRECLDAHNLLRVRYGSPLLVWSQELADLAHTWALKLAERGRILYPELPGILSSATIENHVQALARTFG